MGQETGLKVKFKQYPSIFWVVITLEMLERGAYYGIMGYFPIHCMENLGFSGTQVGLLYGSLMFLLYLIPLLASSLARKYGYKSILVVAFALLAPTYFVLTFIGSFYGIFLLIIAWGIGAGAFKPMISATIAEVTEKAKRNSAYAIYYLSINWGSLIAMVAIGLLIPQHFAHLTFIVGGVLITVNLLITLVMYNNPVEPNSKERVTDAFVKMVKVLADGKFTVLLLIYAGFFFIFSSMHTFLPAYYVQFGIKPWGWLEAPLIGAINPLTIVMLGPFLSRYMDRYDSLKLMIGGMFLFCIGLFLLGMIPIWYAFAIGVLIFSIGEFLTHPSFISYVSKIAPEEKVAMYMGYAFLPSAVGQVTGSIFGGMLYDGVAVNLEKPSFFWAIYVAIGLISIGNFLIYNRWITKKKGITRKKRTFFSSRLSNVGVYGLVVIVLFGGFSAGVTQYIGGKDAPDEPDFDIKMFDLMKGAPIFISDYATEGQPHEVVQNISEKMVASISFRLTWTDEEDAGWIGPAPVRENQPDTFTVIITGPTAGLTAHETGSNTHGREGVIQFVVEVPVQIDEALNGTGDWEIFIEVDAGDHEPVMGLGMKFTDSGNDFTLEMTYEYYVKAE